MEKKPVVLGQWIRVSNNDAVVCQIIEEPPPEIEVVYLQGNQAVNRCAIWTEKGWIFDPNEGDYGGYADNYPRLSEYVAKLRRGRWREPWQ